MSETYVTYRVWDGCKAPVNLEYSGRLMGQIVRESTIDRDALLDLADELDRVGYNDWLYSGEWDPEDIARRIRKALGAVE